MVDVVDLRPRTRQPSGVPALNKAHPLARKVFAWTCGDIGATRSGKVVTAASRFVSSGGVGGTFLFPYAPELEKSSGSAVFALIDGAAAAALPAFTAISAYGFYAGTPDEFLDSFVTSWSGGYPNYALLHRDNLNYIDIQGTYSWAPGITKYRHVWDWDSNSAWVDFNGGGVINANYSPSGTFRTDVRKQLNIGPCTLSFTFDVLPTAAEWAQLAANPWQLIAPDEETTYFVAGGGSTVVSSDSTQSYQASASLTAYAAQTYLASQAVAADSPQTYIASQTAQADTSQNYQAGVQVAADTAQTYAAYAALSTDSAQTYTAQTQVASDSSQSYPALQSLSADATQTYAGLAYASADSVQAYTALQLVLKDTAQSYLASALVSTDSAQTYDAAVLGSSTVSANSVQSYTAIGLVSADSAQSYTATATAAADSAQGYLALATVGADAPQGYSAFQWTILDTTQTYTAGEQVSVDHPQTYTAFADGFMSVSSDCVQVYGAIGKVSTIPLTGLRNPFGRDRVGISRTYGGRNQISSTNRRHTY